MGKGEWKVLRSVPLFAPVANAIVFPPLLSLKEMTSLEMRRRRRRRRRGRRRRRIRKRRRILTECEEAEDDGVGDEVDGVAGAGEVELPAPDALVH